MPNSHVSADEWIDSDALGLEIFSEGKRVGTLSSSHGELRFQYDEDWIRNGDPLSDFLPFSGKFGSDDIYKYFDAFMPEGRRRDALIRQDKIWGMDLVGFLRRHGEDLPGKLYAFPLGKSNCNEDITRKIAKLTETDDSFMNIGKQHSLLAGVDDKIAVIASRKDGRWTFQLSNIENPSTHIIKKSNQLCVNEAFCMKLAHLCGLPVMPSDLLAFNGKEAFITQRYDRILDESDPHGKRVIRIEQKDFCQLAGKSSDEKYYRGFIGLSNEDIAKILEPLPFDNTWAFLAGNMFSMIIGNNDDHGKNYSLLYAPDPQLAPFYDLASISGMMMYDETAGGTNMLSRPIGKAKFAAHIKPEDFAEYVNVFGVDYEEFVR